MSRIRTLLFVAVPLALWACGGSNSSSSGATVFNATLSGANETPPVSGGGTGTATFTLSGSTVNYSVVATGLSGSATGAHIHVGASGVAGPIVVDIAAITPPPAGTSFSIQGSFTAANIKPQTSPTIATLDDLVAQMRAGNTYFNIHTAAHASGETRGQLAGQ